MWKYDIFRIYCIDVAAIFYAKNIQEFVIPENYYMKLLNHNFAILLMMPFSIIIVLKTVWIRRFI